MPFELFNTQARTAIPIPHIQEPLSETSELQPSTPSTPKSKLRSFFDWRRPSNRSLRPSTRSGDEYMIHASESRDSSFRPAPSPRTQSANHDTATANISQRSERRHSQKKDRIITDPPPLAQVPSQAIMSASLEVPALFTEKLRSRRGSLSSRIAPGQEVHEDTVEVKRSHRRTDSGQSSCSLRSKMVFMINGPYLLQYNSDGEGNALPEKILALDRDSVAFACDAVPGRPWVLQVSRSANLAVKGQAHVLRPSWSRLTLRQAEDKRTVNTLLLVFNDSEDLYTWLFAIRKEIEHLGGMEYRPGIDDDDQTWRDNLEKEFATHSDNGGPRSRKSSAAHAMSPTKQTFTSKYPAKSPAHQDTRPQSIESCTSSKKSSTSLDRLRDSATSCSYPPTLATSSGDGSAPSTSPTCEHFLSINSMTDQIQGDLSLRAYTLNSELAQHQPKSPVPTQSILERRKLSVGSLQLVHQDEPRARKILPDLPSTISGSPNEASPRLTSPGLKSPLGQNPLYPQTREGDRTTIPSSSPILVEHQLTSSVKRDMVRKLSTIEITGGAQKSKYSLFPVRPSPDARHEYLAVPIAVTSPAPASSTLAFRNSGTVEGMSKEPRHKKKRSRTVTLELRQHRVSALLGAGHVDLPQRSPAVTDDMIMSNFGIAGSKPPPSPLPEVKVPGLADLNMDLDFLRTPHRELVKKQGPAAEQRRSSTKSVSSLRSDASATTTKSLGPPPPGPLPAIPSESRRSSRNHRSSQHSQRSRHNSTRPNGQQATEAMKQQNMLLEGVYVSSEPPSYDVAINEVKQSHRRTISSSLDGPAPPSRASSKPLEQTKKSRSRSRSRTRKKSNIKQQS